jgi:hypothetical protein
MDTCLGHNDIDVIENNKFGHGEAHLKTSMKQLD